MNAAVQTPLHIPALPQPFAAYGWLITFAAFADEPLGTMGPASVRHSAEQIRANGREFRMLDDDGEHCYSGFYLGEDDETMFSPLDDFGMPNCGCTRIEYRNAQGTWEAL